MQSNCEVIIISSGRSLVLLKNEFPHFTMYDVSAYNIEYQRSGNFILKIGMQLFKVFNGIRTEHLELNKIVITEKPDLIIADNRYGMYHPNVHSIIITHQLMVKIPGIKFMQSIVKRWLYYRHKKFDAVWVPDMEKEPNIAGDLSHAGIKPRNIKYLGVLTRFKKLKETPPSTGKILVIISGPEPQRTLFEEMILKQAAILTYPFIIVQGKSEKQEMKMLDSHIQIISHCNSDALFALAEEAEIIISRGGYSTLMDLSQLNKKCIFIPTPGQTEQEYLVQQLSKNNQVLYGKQEDCNIGELIEKINQSDIRFYIPADTQFFKQVVNDAISSID
ncbi:MAG: glycosyltransferase [Chitinophagales bacterium]|nr:glycosyltransferase [Bacteroidota bacterium]MBK8486605.1 glycosyltransferase [Bacteroidota bacterium]MBK8683386.1 glycosyltransferase [Bacteroidota bacterium]